MGTPLSQAVDRDVLPSVGSKGGGALGAQAPSPPPPLRFINVLYAVYQMSVLPLTIELLLWQRYKATLKQSLVSQAW